MPDRSRDRTQFDPKDVPPPVYLPGASETEPSVNWISGWPERVSDAQGIEYHRLRDGKTTGKGQGDSCLYGKIVDDAGEKPVVEGTTQYVPTALSKKADNVTMSGGIWYAAPDLENTYIRRLS